ncbi:hypothetical protein Pint_28175 [Pistacia integerrima]|uniref:Uncharacterized protein n=2 Tax=Pistacia TaxID=55512 RepID=A0ACC1BBR6_9ROSI|nr:hypothetical protein Pint_28175 [Pistacia integerrima]KAJ0096370.1 hypothetical protein Patl1_28825 [Pistacia atlantica]
MARVCSNPVGLHRFPPSFHPIHQSPQQIKTCLNSQHKSRRFPTLVACQTTPNPPETKPEEVVVETDSATDSTSTQATSSSTDSGFTQFPNKEINKRVAIASTLGALGFFLFTRLDFGVSLKDLTAIALPYEEALSNGKPTVLEFYADWCEVCRELAPEVYKVEQQYK